MIQTKDAGSSAGLERFDTPSGRRPQDWRAPLAHAHAGDREVARIAALVEDGERITAEDALVLHERADLLTLGRLADLVRLRKHPSGVVTYIIDRNINPTNVCLTDCGFCAFYRSPGDVDAYVLSRDEIYGKVKELSDLGGRQVLMQGGHHPRVLSDWWGQLISDLRERFPNVNSHALSAPEIDHFSHYEKRPVEDVLRDLKDAGLGSVPGAGAEMLVERVRKIIAPKKTTTDRWLDVHRKIHEAGLRSSATMMFGHVETAAERVEHLVRVRDLQDETGGFTAFISWTCQPDGVPQEQDYPEKATPAVYLRVQALSRIFLDNVQNIQTSYVTQGMKMGQMSLRFGANDFGGTMIEENVVSAAGCFNLESVQKVEHLIQTAGFTPRQRNSWYGIVDERCEEPVFPATREDAAVKA
ncbi:Aminodeoxyfutalosine synthase [Planctomycetes bacterium Poly30]|uniref:Cyclic dehypoxanthine futalosine synthase n=1 Tax=Saltatorellus ferox TaxID=2528018 RepID=A0A518EX38_9BACT|nr:Aminodeoxyfutalosine synthase [Planctomycetes bacterium Poly30]